MSAWAYPSDMDYYERWGGDLEPEEEPVVPFTNEPACSQCFDPAKDGLVCWTCKKRLCGRKPCAREANGDVFCADCWPAAIESALEGALADDATRIAYRNALVRIVARSSYGDPADWYRAYGDMLDLACAALVGQPIDPPTTATESTASLVLATRRTTHGD